MSELYYIPREILAKVFPDARSVRAFEDMMRQSKDLIPADINALSKLLSDLSAQVDILLSAPLPETSEDSDLTMISALAPACVNVDYDAAKKRIFAGYLSADQTVTSGAATKVQIDTVEYDTHGEFDNVTNYRYTPKQAGYYRVTAELSSLNSTSPTGCFCGVYKNGAAYKYGTYMATTTIPSSSLNCIVYMNGATDYLEMYGWVYAATAKMRGLSTHTFLAIEMIKAV